MTASKNDLLRLALLWWCGTALRITILAVPPLLLPIQHGLHLSATEVGLLSGLPIAMLAIAAVPGSLLIARLGPRIALVVGLLLVSLGAALRGGSWNALSLYVATMIMGAGVAVMQPAMPVAVREWLPSRIGFATAIYSNGLLAGEILVVWLTPILMPFLQNSWRLGLSIWSLPVLFTAMSVIALAPKTSNTGSASTTAAVWWPNWRDPLIWWLGVLFGSVNVVYFASNAFIPAYLNSLGRGDLVQNALIALNFGQLPASFVLAAVAKKLERRLWPYLCAGCALTICVSGLVFMPGALTVVWAGLMGFSVASALVLGFTLPPLLAESRDVARISAAMFTLSYTIGMTVAVLSGAVSDLTGHPAWAFGPIALCTLTLSGSSFALHLQGKLR